MTHHEPRTAVRDPYVQWSPFPGRPRLTWPGGAPIALVVVLTVGHVEWHPPAGAAIAPSTVRVGPYPDVPDVHELSPHEYRPRVRIHRFMDLFDRLGIVATVAMDAAAIERHPDLVDAVGQRGWELVGHGVTGNRMITSRMTEEEERDHLGTALDAVARVTGRAPRGWAGVDYAESTRTDRLLAEMGVDYVVDWPNDEQPYKMTVPIGSIVSLPVTLDLDDVQFHAIRTISIRRFAELIVDSYETLRRDGASTGRLIVMNLHPYVTGQPYRFRHIEAAFEELVKGGGCWSATGAQTVDAYLDQDAGGRD